MSKLSIDRTVTLTASAPAGSRHRGYEEIIIQDIAFRPEVTLYKRERWTTPDGRTVVADLPAGVVGGCGPQLHRLVLTLHFQGQMTCERIVAVLTAAGVAISKRQVVRLLTAKLNLFRAEDEAVFTAGLRASGYVSVDDTGARHAGKAWYTTQFGSDRFTVFRTGPSKSRLALPHAISWAGRRATPSTRRRPPTCARPMWCTASSTLSSAPTSTNSAPRPSGSLISPRSASPWCG
ncbi:MAG TPA: transposase [Roseiarcus sp.]|nr:transposase [Roseiarcus sp.]